MPGGMGMMQPAATVAPTVAPTAAPPTAPAPGASATATPAAAAPLTPSAIYAQDCAICHGASRQGGTAPPLLPSTLTGDPSYYVRVVTYGFPGSLMLGWRGRLTDDQIRALVDYLRTTP
jgi:mono/diheme cytochrome c family protein